ncbi:MAG: 1-deoxy-D-xylulose-5-phosphate reductoisomerase [Candidatus Kaelpia imicola]|nr:1-deoxy-D-xylulose-5-phosphate reductoisomerase [Candidatus Kaelpia imicola]
MKKIAILGSTGSVGRQILDIVEKSNGLFKIVALGSDRNIELLAQQAKKFKVDNIFLNRAKDIGRLPFEVFESQNDFLNFVAGQKVDLLILALSGTDAIRPLIFALENDINLAIANKEAIIAAGSIVNNIRASSSSEIIPLDSEHNAIFQLLKGVDKDEISKVFLTCSGGPFLDFSDRELENVSLDMALSHPRWEMGNKITIDSATLMNKGFEVIEACYLFGLSSDFMEVIIHPEAIIHAMIELKDGTTFAEMALPDMRVSIAHALGYPDRFDSGLRIDWRSLEKMSFKAVSIESYPALRIAYDALERGGSLPAFIVKVDEIIVNEFLGSKIAFKDIISSVEEAVRRHDVFEIDSLKDIERVFRDAEEISTDIIKEVGKI